MVTGVDPAFVAENPPNAIQSPYTYALRNYFVRLPQNYDPNTPYPVHFGGGGCGNTNGMSGQGGGFTVLDGGQDQAIQIGMSYTYSGGACFEDGHANTAEVPYFDAMIADIKANYCVDQEKVFMAGYSSGAWQSYTLGLARAGIIRGIATAAGGLRAERPMPSDLPFAALLLTGDGDGSNPIDGPTGSALARDEILMRNGCVGTDTMPWAVFPDNNCVQYTGCPEAFPVVWCTPPGGHTDGGGGYKDAIETFWSSLPPVP
jgi:predicted esterase